MKSLKELKSEFEKFKEELPIHLSRLKEELNLTELIFDKAEVDSVQEFYLKKYPLLDADSKENLKKMFIAYCSTAFIGSNGGILELSTTKNCDTYGEPIIIKYGGKNYPWVAMSINAWMDRLETNRFRGNLSEVVLRNLKNVS